MPRVPLLALLLAVAGCTHGPARGLLAPDDVPEGWTVHETDHFQVQTDAGADHARSLGSRLERILVLYRETLPSDRPLPRFAVKFFRRYQDYLKYGGQESTSGFYDVDSRELVVADVSGVTYDVDVPADLANPDSPRETRSIHVARPQQEMISALYHEAWHQYFHWYLDTDADIPVWLDEGMADYFGQARPRGDRFRLGATHRKWLELLRPSLESGRTVPLAKFIGLDRDTYYKDFLLCYPQGWSLVHFLLNSEEATYREIPARLIEAMRRTADPEKSLEEAFRGVDLAEMERDWKAHVSKLR